MKKNLPFITAIALFATLTISAQSFAQQPHYKLVDLGTFGGKQSYVNFGSGNYFGSHTEAVNPEGAVVGFADTSASDPFQSFCFWDCSVAHAFLSDRSGKLTNLGALPGGGSSAPNWITANGFIAGESENGETDPLYSGLPQMRAVLWFDDHIFNLGTLEDGYQSEANAVNSFGQVVGAALNTVADDNSMEVNVFWLWASISPVYPYQTRAFIWDALNGMQDLGTLGEGTDAQALLINDRGQVVGHSYLNSTPSPNCAYPLTTRSFIWEKQTGMVDLGSFGGTCTLATDLNQRGQVVGSSNFEGDQSYGAFLWEREQLHRLGGSLGGKCTGAFAINEAGESVGFGYLAGGDCLTGNAAFHATVWRNVNQITDLGVIGNDEASFAAGINARGQVVGSSVPTLNSDPTNSRAFLWQDGSIFDLNTLIPSGSPLYLQYVDTINDLGEIVGQGVDSSGNEHAFLLVPCNNSSDCEESPADEATSAPAAPTAHTQLAPTGGSRALRFMPSRSLSPVSQTHAPAGGAGDSSVGMKSDSSSRGEDLVTQHERASLYAEQRGYCLVGNGELTGSCYGEATPFVCSAGKSSSCLVGAKAIRPEEHHCGLFGIATVDVARPCSF